MLVLTRAQTERLLDHDALLDALERAMIDLSAGRASVPERVAALVGDRGFLGAMPAYVPSLSILSAKLVTSFPANTAAPTHQALVLVFSPEDGSPVAIMDGDSITAARTAAGSALATRLLARQDAQVLAIVGTGVQAQAHGRAVRRVGRFRQVRVAGRDPSRARALAARIDATPIETIAEAVRSADVVCTTTHAAEPVIAFDDLSPGTHVNAVGFHPAGGELDRSILRGAALFVESRAVALAPFPAGPPDLARAFAEGELTPASIRAEIGEVAARTEPGRTSNDEITVYRSVGVGVQDAAAAAVVLDRARALGVGASVER